jgi:hypothetical protein
MLGVGAALVAAAVYYYQHSDDPSPSPPAGQTAKPAPEVSQPQMPPPEKAEKTEAVPVAATDPVPAAGAQLPALDAQLPVADDAVPEWQTDPAGAIDPRRLAQAELELVNNQIYEEVARSTLPPLSIQTHNPVWQLEQEAAQGNTVSDDGPSSDITLTESQTGPLEAPESGEFGNIQPPEGEIWLRIPAEYSQEHRDIMAQHADLYRVESGYSGPITVMLWVGGRPYARQQYE